jgi:type II secretory pathway component GspD/PulD (secretin)
MRLILLILFLLSLAGWGIYKVTADDDPSLLNLAAGNASETIVDEGKKIANYGNKPVPTHEKEYLPPIITRAFTFKHRPLPKNEFFQSLNVSNGTSSSLRVPLRLTTDADTRTCVIIGHSDEVLIIADALKMSDVPANSCHAKAWIVFVRSDKNDAFDFGLQLTTMPDISSFKLDSKTFSGMLAVHNVEARLDVLHSRGLVEVVQAPHLQMSNNQISLIETGEEIAVPIVTVSQNVTQTTVEYRKVGLSLELTPQFLADDKIRLKIKQSNGLVGQLRDVGGVEVPELTNQSLMNTIETRVGKVVVLGGVESSQYQKVKGFLSYKKERQTGYLYVVLATYSSVPLAVPVLESVQDGSALLPPKPKNK